MDRRTAFAIGAAAVVAAAALSIPALAHRTAPEAAPPPGNGWVLAFSDDFSGTTVDSAQWTDRSSAEADDGEREQLAGHSTSAVEPRIAEGERQHEAKQKSRAGGDEREGADRHAGGHGERAWRGETSHRSHQMRTRSGGAR